MINVVQTFRALSMSTIEGIDIMAIKFKNIYQSVQKKQYDILDPRKTEFDVDFVDFMAKIEGLEVNSIAIYNLIGGGFHHYCLNSTTLSHYQTSKYYSMTRKALLNYVSLRYKYKHLCELVLEEFCLHNMHSSYFKGIGKYGLKDFKAT